MGFLHSLFLYPASCGASAKVASKAVEEASSSRKAFQSKKGYFVGMREILRGKGSLMLAYRLSETSHKSPKLASACSTVLSVVCVVAACLPDKHWEAGMEDEE